MRSWLTILVICLAGASTTSAHEGPQRLEPISEQAMVLPKWEVHSTSPLFGNTRTGGRDDRVFSFTPDGRTILGMDGGAWQFQRFDVASGTSLGPFGNADDRTLAAISPDNKHFLTLGADGDVSVWSLENLRYLRSLDEGVNFANFRAATFLNNRHCLLVGVEEQSRVICLWDIETGDEIARQTMPGTTSGSGRANLRLPTALAVSPFGETLAVVEGSQVVLRERRTGALRRTIGMLPGTSEVPVRIQPATFSRDGRILAIAHGKYVWLFDAIGNSQFAPLTGHSANVRALFFTPDNQHLLTLGDDQRILTWDKSELTTPIVTPRTPTKNELGPLIEAALGGDPWERFCADIRLRSNPDGVVEILREQLKPVEGIAPADLERILTGLASPDIQERKKAAKAMKGRGDQVRATISSGARARVDRGGDVVAAREVTARLRRLEMDFSRRFNETPEDEGLEQESRKLEILVRLRSPAARQLVENITKGAQTATLTQLAEERLLNWPIDDLAHQASDAVDKKFELQLIGGDAPVAYAAMTLGLRRWPQQRDAVRTELARLSQSTALGNDAMVVERLIKLLDAEDFADRERAQEQLTQMGKEIRPLLQAELEKTPSLEVKQRLNAALAKLGVRKTSTDELLTWRLLELVALAEGKDSEILGEIATSAKNAWVREQVVKLRQPR